MNKILYILYDDTLNGNIVAGNEDTWHKVWTYYNWSQVNTHNTACVHGIGATGIIHNSYYYDKSQPVPSGDICVFRPVIEFKE